MSPALHQSQSQPRAARALPCRFMRTRLSNWPDGDRILHITTGTGSQVTRQTPLGSLGPFLAPSLIRFVINKPPFDDHCWRAAASIL